MNFQWEICYNCIYINVNDRNIAKLELRDQVKKNAKDTIDKLLKLGIKISMFTGDSKDIALDIASSVGIKDVYYELLPEDKYNLLEEKLKKKNGLIAMVGDGVNDAPSLARTDIGISMGGLGQDSAIEYSDVVIMNDDLSKIVDMINISKKTNIIIKQNLIFSISIKILVLFL